MGSVERDASDRTGPGPVGVVEGGDAVEVCLLVDEAGVSERDAELAVFLSARGSFRHPKVVRVEAPSHGDRFRRFANRGQEPVAPSGAEHRCRRLDPLRVEAVCRVEHRSFADRAINSIGELGLVGCKFQLCEAASTAPSASADRVASLGSSHSG